MAKSKSKPKNTGIQTFKNGINNQQRKEKNMNGPLFHGARTTQPTMEQLQYRLNSDIALLKKHPEHKEMLEERIVCTKVQILNAALGFPL